MEDSIELLKQIEIFEKKATDIIHNQNEIIKLEESLLDVIAAAERNGMRKGVLLMATIM